MPTKEEYEFVFAEESDNRYLNIDIYEKKCGYVLDKYKLERAARVLACPIKANPPNWQHGRVIYSTFRRYLDNEVSSPIVILDVGTAKGFSALCALWALNDSNKFGKVYSIDVIDPLSIELRNTIAGLKNLYQILVPWPEANAIEFKKMRGVNWLSNGSGRVHFSFLDGKHKYSEVQLEIDLLDKRQESGDIIIFDDLQIPGVMKAVDEVENYFIEKLFVKEDRGYAIAVKK